MTTADQTWRTHGEGSAPTRCPSCAADPVKGAPDPGTLAFQCGRVLADDGSGVLEVGHCAWGLHMQSEAAARAARVVESTPISMEEYPVVVPVLGRIVAALQRAFENPAAHRPHSDLS